jgi:hypothetical protein
LGGGLIGLASYSIGVAVTGQKWNLGGALKATFFGAISGAATFGIGEIFTVVKDGVQVATEFAKTTLGFIAHTAAHGVSQGVLSMMQGGNFFTGAVSGMLGHLGAQAWGATMRGIGLNKFAQSTGGMIAFGALSGGVGAELSGGNFWQGVVIGGTVAGLNSAMHKFDSPKDPPKRKLTAAQAKERWQSRIGGSVDVDVSTIDWSNADLTEAGNAPGTYRVRFDSRNFTNPDQAMVQATITIEPVEGKNGYYQIAVDGETRANAFKNFVNSNKISTLAR